MVEGTVMHTIVVELSGEDGKATTTVMQTYDPSKQTLGQVLREIANKEEPVKYFHPEFGAVTVCRCGKHHVCAKCLAGGKK